MSEEKNMEVNETANIDSLISNFADFAYNYITIQRLKKPLLS
jgi:hypothetical protein